MACLVCGSSDVAEHLDVGSHPIASHFPTERDAPERRFRLALGQCGRCGTIQIMAPVPHDALVPPYDWLFAREPEQHLDTVVERVIALPGVGPDSVIGALTSKDDTTVERFRRKGFSRTWRVRLDEDLGITNPNANIESVQRLTEPSRMKAIAAKRGGADVLIVRHIVEHVENLQDFLGGLAELVNPGGILMLEAPDCMASLRLDDYCMVWEEHSLYLTPETFAPLATIGGFEPVRLDVYQMPFENCMVQLSRKVRPPGPLRGNPAARAQNGLLARYAANYDPTRRVVRRRLEKVRAERGPVALFGAGHLACAFSNFMGISDLIEFVADDTPQKQGKYLPGTGIPIVPSAALAQNGIALCLLALSINNEDTVIARNEAFTRAGGQFRSIFRASPRSFFGTDTNVAPA